MLKASIPFALATLILGTSGFAAQSSMPLSTATPPVASAAPPAASTQPAEKLVCQSVVTSEPGSKPRSMCMTKREWAAKKLADGKDPNRIVCRYETNSRSKFASFKVCMSFVEWQNQRQLEREHVERIQSNVCVKGGGC